MVVRKAMLVKALMWHTNISLRYFCCTDIYLFIYLLCRCCYYLFCLIPPTSTLPKPTHSPGSCFSIKYFFSPSEQSITWLKHKICVCVCIFLWNSLGAKNNPNCRLKHDCLPSGRLKIMHCFSNRTCQNPADQSGLGKHGASATPSRNSSVVCGRKSYHLP